MLIWIGEAKYSYSVSTHLVNNVKRSKIAGETFHCNVKVDLYKVVSMLNRTINREIMVEFKGNKNSNRNIADYR